MEQPIGQTKKEDADLRPFCSIENLSRYALNAKEKP